MAWRFIRHGGNITILLHLDMVQQVRAVLLVEFKLCESILQHGDYDVSVGNIVLQLLPECTDDIFRHAAIPRFHRAQVARPLSGDCQEFRA